VTDGMKLSVALLLVMILAQGVPAFAESTDLPNTGLADRIDFWKKVYTQYGEDDVIIHDRIRVNLIYDVAVRREHAGEVDAVQEAHNQSRANLDTPEALSPTAKQIRDLLVSNGVSLTPATLSELHENVHTQIGIKERFREGVIRSGRYIDAFR